MVATPLALYVTPLVVTLFPYTLDSAIAVIVTIALDEAVNVPFA